MTTQRADNNGPKPPAPVQEVGFSDLEPDMDFLLDPLRDFDTDEERCVNQTLTRCDLCRDPETAWEQEDPTGVKLAAHKQRWHATETEAVTALVTADPSHADDVKAVIDAIEMVAAAHDGQVDPNNVRRLLPAWVLPQCVGAVYNQLVAQRRLERIGWTTNEDRRGRNVGKPLPLYLLREAS